MIPNATPATQPRTTHEIIKDDQLIQENIVWVINFIPFIKYGIMNMKSFY